MVCGFSSVYIDFHVAHLSLKQSKSFYTYKILFEIIIHLRRKKSKTRMLMKTMTKRQKIRSLAIKKKRKLEEKKNISCLSA